MHKIKFSILMFGFIVAPAFNIFAMLKPEEKAGLRKQLNKLSKIIKKDDRAVNAAYVLIKSQEILEKTHCFECGLARRTQQLMNRAENKLTPQGINVTNCARRLLIEDDTIEDINIEIDILNYLS